jgi:hypothetical protein
MMIILAAAGLITAVVLLVRRYGGARAALIVSGPVMYPLVLLGVGVLGGVLGSAVRPRPAATAEAGA